MIQAGKSDDEIVEFLVARYGDFVLYNPPVKPANYLHLVRPVRAAAGCRLPAAARHTPPETYRGH